MNRIMADLRKLADPAPGAEPDGEVTLHVASMSSRCGACDGNADPSEKAHLMMRMEGWGCGAVFTHVAADNAGRVAEANTRDLRPDLIWRGAT